MNKPSLVLVHGWLANTSCWNELLPYFNDYEIITVELPGHSKTARGTFFNLPELLEIFSSQVPNHSIWLGWSLGGFIAQMMADKYPHKVSHLICLCCGLSFVKNEQWKYGLSIEKFEHFKENFIADTQQGVKEFIALQSLGDCNADKVRKALLSYKTDDTDTTELVEGLHILEEINLVDKVNNYQCPTLFIAGSEDYLVDAHGVEIASYQLQDERGDFINLQGNGHCPMISEPNKLADALIKWIEQ